MGETQVTDWSQRENPGQDAARRAHIQAVFEVGVKTLTRCPDCSAFLMEAITHSGARIRVETTAYERFVVVDEKLWVASGYVLRDHRHSCRPRPNVMAEAHAEYAETAAFTTEAEWAEHTEAKLRARQERWSAFGDVPDPNPMARGPVS